MPKTTPLTLAQLQCFQSPVRVSMYGAMRSLGPSSIRELAAPVGARPDALYYHMRLLVDAGLATQLEPRERNGRKEAVYAILGGPYDLDDLLADHDYREAALKSMQGISRHSMRTLRRAVERVEHEPARSSQIAFHWINAKLRPKAIGEVLKRLNDLIVDAMEIDEDKDAERMMIFAIAAPVLGRRSKKSERG